MSIYLVGGAVRDTLLKRRIRDKDFVVVGVDSKFLLNKGFIPVKGSFPVFIDPVTGNQYSLARTERKVGKGYLGFECFSNTSITLEADLKRRDITINSLALNHRGHIIDVSNGLQDLKDRVLRHTSDAFIEDPLRILRVARFRSVLHAYGFTIAPETMRLMQNMASDMEEIQHLTGERILGELHKALKSHSPSYFFRTCDQIKVPKDELPYLRFWPENNLQTLDKVPSQYRMSYIAYCLNKNSYRVMISDLPFTKYDKNLISFIRNNYSAIVSWNQNKGKHDTAALTIKLLSHKHYIQDIFNTCIAIYVSEYGIYPLNLMHLCEITLAVDQIPYGAIIAKSKKYDMKRIDFKKIRYEAVLNCINSFITH